MKKKKQTRVYEFTPTGILQYQQDKLKLLRPIVERAVNKMLKKKGYKDVQFKFVENNSL